MAVRLSHSESLFGARMTLLFWAPRGRVTPVADELHLVLDCDCSSVASQEP